MVVSTTLQHALRALGCLSALEPGESVFGRDLAELAEVPVSYLSKILHTLGKAGLVDAVRGVHGGYQLARPAAEITLRQVFEAIEPGAMTTCVLHGQRPCSNEAACPIHPRWRAVREAFDVFLDESTVQDIAPNLDPAQA